MHHLPRTTFLDRQHGMAAWVLQSLSVQHVPGELTVKDMLKSLQFACGIRTRRYCCSVFLCLDGGWLDARERVAQVPVPIEVHSCSGVSDQTLGAPVLNPYWTQQ